MTAKTMADKRESELNHRLAGAFVIIAGLFMLIRTDLEKGFPWTKYVWPATFLASGIFLLVWSDTELWPFGHRPWMEALRNNPEVRQHKTYAVLMLVLGMGMAANQRRFESRLEPLGVSRDRRGWLRATAISRTWRRNARPKSHAGDGEDQERHLSFAVVGIAIGLTNAVAGKKGTWRCTFARIWPVLMVALGSYYYFIANRKFSGEAGSCADGPDTIQHALKSGDCN